jgi:protocatechuate 3,4-dioxygenase alpha subunit
MTERPVTERLGITPSQTVGPYFAYALTPTDYSLTALTGNDLVTPDTVGHPIVIEGRVIDGDGAPVPDCFLELWQADGAGRYPGQPGERPNTTFKGFGRSAADSEGRYRFHTVKPGPVPGLEGKMQAPHINVGVFARGILRRMFTRIYFADEAANDGDAILALVPADRRQTLIAQRDGTANGTPRYVFNVKLHGDDETAFFEA